MRASYHSVRGVRLQEQLDHLRIELRAGVLVQVVAGARFAPGAAVGPVGAQRVPHIHHSEQPGGQGDVLAPACRSGAREVTCSW